eukprot:TRINITY_DN8510_c0_g1_i1.p1 TRINITY_DN8510_c0_g1~~TRINITY_DN8510_c0_g1_i1.p1  ORF type:complete len:124 (+),score=44.37 TRINITY_DN8510_c0_g1_i1:127-498(+)
MCIRDRYQRRVRGTNWIEAMDALLKSKKYPEALEAALANGLAADPADVLKVVSKAKDEADINACVGALSDPDQQDLLMRLLYKFLSNNQSASNSLKWHQALAKHAGVGCVMRALADRTLLMTV